MHAASDYLHYSDHSPVYLGQETIHPWPLQPWNLGVPAGRSQYGMDDLCNGCILPSHRDATNTRQHELCVDSFWRYMCRQYRYVFLPALRSVQVV